MIHLRDSPAAPARAARCRAAAILLTLGAVAAGCGTAVPAHLSADGQAPAVESTGRLEVAPSSPDAAAASATPAVPVVRIATDLVGREVKPGVWVITHRRPMPANSLVVVGASSLLLVDTPWNAAATEALLGWLDERFGARRKQAVSTHFHQDAIGGNGVLRRAGVSITGLGHTKFLVERRAPARLHELRRSLTGQPYDRALLAGAEFVPPNSLFQASRLGLLLDREPYVLLYPGPAHSFDNLAVYLPERNVLFGGCMVKAGSSLGFTGDADLANWPAALAKLQELEVEVVVPGHGARFDADLLQHTLGLLAEVAKQPAGSG